MVCNNSLGVPRFMKNTRANTNTASTKGLSSVGVWESQCVQRTRDMGGKRKCDKKI